MAHEAGERIHVMDPFAQLALVGLLCMRKNALAVRSDMTANGLKFLLRLSAEEFERG